MKPTLEDRIRQRAYFLSLDGGGADSADFWLIAEREILAEIAVEAPGEAIELIQTAKPTSIMQSIETACGAAIRHVSKHRQLFI